VNVFDRRVQTCIESHGYFQHLLQKHRRAFKILSGFFSKRKLLHVHVNFMYCFAVKNSPPPPSSVYIPLYTPYIPIVDRYGGFCFEDDLNMWSNLENEFNTPNPYEKSSCQHGSPPSRLGRSPRKTILPLSTPQWCLKGNFSDVLPEIGGGGGPPSRHISQNPWVRCLFCRPDSRLTPSLPEGYQSL
jgi:hypothetical protein